MSESEVNWLEYFSGSVPTPEYFRITLEDLGGISALDKDPSLGINRLQELCFIGLVSYFEGFCKDLLACLINIEPSLISNLKANGHNVEVDATRVALYAGEVSRRLGFVLAEKYDFGSARKINSIFGALLTRTPFGSDDERHYAGLLRDRNLLVHHGGTFTLSYLEQTRPSLSSLQTDAFFDSRVIGRADVAAAIAFVEGIARKLSKGSHAALVRYMSSHAICYSGERQKALDGLLHWRTSDI